MSTKGPSIDAIRRFKEQQEQKKREEDERKIREKLSTLEHRSTRGDRKAKQELKKIRDQIDKPPPPPPQPQSRHHHREQLNSKDTSTQSRPRVKSKPAETFNFDELMKLAQQNNNQINQKPQHAPPSETVRIPKKQQPASQKRTSEPARQTKPNEPVKSNNKAPARRDVPQVRNVARPQQPPPPPSRNLPPKGMPQAKRNYFPPPSRPPQSRNLPPQRQLMMAPTRRPMPSTSRYEDDYESDDFVVSDEEYDDARAELNETLRSVFRYDRRRCDEREQELDRQYRAIGNVSTFEDLEREERRASRLAAAEDARAQHEEEERKRLKKLRLDKTIKEKKKR